MTDSNATGFQAVIADLESRGVPHEVIEHEETFTAVAESVAAGSDPRAAGAGPGKTIALRDHDAYRLVFLPAHRHLDVRRTRELTGATRHLRLATEEEMQRDFPGIEVGAMPPIGPRLPALEIIDIRMLDGERVLCAAGDHRHSLLVPTLSLLRATEPRVADICEVRDDIEDW